MFISSADYVERIFCIIITAPNSVRVERTLWHKYDVCVCVCVDSVVITITILLFTCKLNTSYKGSLYITAALYVTVHNAFLFYITYNIYYCIK